MSAQHDILVTVDLTAVTDYPATANVVLPFTADTIILYDDHATARIYVSYNGTDNHRVLIPNTPMWALGEDRNVQKIWLKRETGAFVGTVNCIVEASGET